MDNSLYIVKENYRNGILYCNDRIIINRLVSEFTHEIPGARFLAKRSAHNIPISEKHIHDNGRFNIGIFEYIVDWCKDNNISYEIDPMLQFEGVTSEFIDDCINLIKPSLDGEVIEPYYYQSEAVQLALSKRNYILVSPTSSGKSLIQYLIARIVLGYNPTYKMLLIVPTVSLTSQMLEDFGEYSELVEWNAEDECHVIKAGKKKDSDKRIYISTYQSITKQPKEYFEQFNIVMVDEVHTAMCKSVKTIMKHCSNAYFRLGLTGTLQSDMHSQMSICGMFGKWSQVVTTKDLMDQRKVANLDIVIKKFKYDAEFSKYRFTKRYNDLGDELPYEYRDEIDLITSIPSRDSAIKDLLLQCDGNTIVMINKINHGKRLRKYFKKEFPNRDVYLYTGSTKASDRDNIRHEIENCDNAIIIGSIGVLSTGVSIKRLNYLITGHPVKSKIKVLQSIGRILRKSKYSNDVTLFDIVDNISYKGKYNYVYRHGKDRENHYKDQKFNFTSETIELNIPKEEYIIDEYTE